MYYPSSEKKGADQFRGYREADLRLCFRLCILLVFPWGGSYVHSSSQCDYAHCLGPAHFFLEEEEDEKHETLTEFYCLVWYKN